MNQNMPETLTWYRALDRTGCRAAAAFFVGAALCASGCGGEGEDLDDVVAELSEKCALDSQCVSPLVCSFERCHVECESDRDCRQSSARCVQSDTRGVFVCQLADETECIRNADCPISLVCGPDGECRGRCQDDDECPKDQLCTEESGLCAAEDELDDDGELPAADEAEATEESEVDAGQLGGTDEDDAMQSVESTDSGDAEPDPEDGVDSGIEETDPSEGDLAEETDSSDAETQTDEMMSMGDTDMPDTVVMSEPEETNVDEIPEGLDFYESDGEETVNNDDRDNAVELTNAASVWIERGDDDWFAVDAPEGVGAQVIEVTLAQAAGAHALVDALSANDFSRIGGFVSQAGTTTTFYVTVASGTRTLFSVVGNNRAGARVDVEVQTSSEVDDYEPNDEQEQAAGIELGAPVTAQMITGYASQVESTLDDWFVVQADAGSLELELLSAPDNLRLSVNVVADGASTLLSVTSPGGTDSWTVGVDEAGPVWFRFVGYQLDAFFSGAKPAHLDETYSFVVNQLPAE